MLGRESKQVGGQSLGGDRARQQRTRRRAQRSCWGGRALEMERHRPPEEQGAHTDHAPSAAAAPAAGARAGAVTECIKAQDPAHSVSDQHHLDERVAPSGGADRR